MAQFRTGNDIKKEVLQKSGEPVSGASPFETIAMTYINKVNHAIVAGGSIFDLTVDEPWVWARSPHPIVLELEPAYTSGSLVCTVNDNAVSFSVAPSSSLEGWHIQVNGTNTAYKIVQHTAGEVAATLDSNFLDDTGAYSYRAFKLDYEILSAFAYVDSFSDRIDFTEGTAATVRTATLTHGAYTLSNLVAHVSARMDTVATAAITGTYDSILKQYSLSCSSSFALLGETGGQALRSVLPTLGFDQRNYTGAQSYTSSYVPSSISRLIEPFKLFTGDPYQPAIYSTDPIKLQEDFPLALVRERTPDRFARIREENNGSIWVRFNSYPKYKTKVQIDWIPVPSDIQDNAVSKPRIPRSDLDVLIHGAAAFIAFDKEDSKFESLINLTKAGLQAMKTKNHGLLNRTGEAFAQIQPRSDYVSPAAKLSYGYTSGSSGAGSTASATETLTAVTLSYTSFQLASTVTSVVARTLPSSRSIFSIIAKHTQSFTGASVTSVALDVGLTADSTYFISNFTVSQAVAGTAQASYVGLYYPAVATDIYVRLTSTGANLSALTTGTLVLYFQESIVP